MTPKGTMTNKLRTIAPLPPGLLSWAACGPFLLSWNYPGLEHQKLGCVARVPAPVVHSLVSHICGLVRAGCGGPASESHPHTGCGCLEVVSTLGSLKL